MKAAFVLLFVAAVLAAVPVDEFDLYLARTNKVYRGVEYVYFLVFSCVLIALVTVRRSSRTTSTSSTPTTPPPLPSRWLPTSSPI